MIEYRNGHLLTKHSNMICNIITNVHIHLFVFLIWAGIKHTALMVRNYEKRRLT